MPSKNKKVIKSTKKTKTAKAKIQAPIDCGAFTSDDFGTIAYPLHITVSGYIDLVNARIINIDEARARLGFPELPKSESLPVDTKQVQDEAKDNVVAIKGNNSENKAEGTLED